MDEETNKRLGELIMELAAGRKSALEEIAVLIERILRTIGNGYFRNKQDVEDAIQDVYVKMYRKAASFETNKNASAWIVRMFENNIKTKLKIRRRENVYLQENAIALDTAKSPVDEQYIENYVFIQDIFKRLSEEDCRLIIYYYWCKCTVREVAEILHKPKSTIAHKLNKLEEKIKKI